MKDVPGNSEYLKDMMNKKDKVWRYFFDLDDKIFKRKNYMFSHMIYTDGYAVSIQFKTEKEVQKKMIEYENLRKIQLKKSEDCKGQSKEWKKIYNEQIKNEKKLADMEYKKRIQEEKERRKKEYNELSKEQKQQLRLKSQQERLAKNNTEEKKINSQDEFPYFEDLTEGQIEKLKQSKLVYVDPGKIRLYTMIDNENKVLKYSNVEYMKRTKRKKYNKKLKNLRDKLGITKLEEYLSNFNSKSCNFKKFNEYVWNKNLVNMSLLKVYQDLTFRKIKWYSYIMKQRETDRLLNLIGKTYGKDCKLIMGDWSPSIQMKNFVSTPMIGLKRKVRKKFEIINIDEFNTSKLNHKTETETENLKLMVEEIKRDENKKIKRNENGEIIKELMLKKIHSVLTYKMSNGRLGCINRDINSVKNMRKITKHWLETRSRLEKYDRKSKAINPSSEASKEENEKVSKVACHLKKDHKNLSKK